MAPARASSADAFIGLGSNLGDRAAQLGAAFAAIGALAGTELVARSSIYASAPVEAVGGEYLNAVARVRTTLSPRRLLAELQAIETRQGRQRPFANAPRPLDLDLLLYDEVVSTAPELVLPHPRLHRRAFVLLPLAEIAPERVIGGFGSARELAARVGAQGVARLER